MLEMVQDRAGELDERESGCSVRTGQSCSEACSCLSSYGEAEYSTREVDSDDCDISRHQIRLGVG